jgi:hypothetical protein
MFLREVGFVKLDDHHPPRATYGGDDDATRSCAPAFSSDFL